MLWTKNVIHAAYGLAVVLLAIAGLYVLLNADFLAVVQIFMYVGGIVILLVFGIMMTNRTKEGLPITKNINLVVGSFFCSTLFGTFAVVIWKSGIQWKLARLPENQVSFIGRELIANHVVAFELIAFLLLTVLVGSAYLAKKSTENDD